MPTTFCSKNSGRDAKLYHNSGTVASPTWTEIKEARDLSLSMTAEEFDVSDRNTKFKLYDHGGIDVEICETIRGLFLSGCGAEFALMSNTISGANGAAEGIRGGFKVFTNSMEFPLADGMTVDISLKPCYFENGSSAFVELSWYDVAGT
jgi:hypothetical protein